MTATRGTGNLEKVSLVLESDQLLKIRTIAHERSDPRTRVSVSDVAREVVELGLESFKQVANTDNAASEDCNQGLAEAAS